VRFALELRTIADAMKRWGGASAPRVPRQSRGAHFDDPPDGAVKLVTVGWDPRQMDHHGLVDTATSSSLYRGHRYPVEIISHCVWLYHRFPLSLREVQEMMAERGVIVSYEIIRAWSQKFGHAYANGLRRRRPRPGDKWLP
jgi:hypothetical protein